MFITQWKVLKNKIEMEMNNTTTNKCLQWITVITIGPKTVAPCFVLVQEKMGLEFYLTSE